MSKTVDERVVEMRFDNQQFERNVQTSMTTLDKLKSSLNFDGAAKGLENLNTATKGFNMSGISSAVETVHAKFSAFEVVAMTALSNITNAAVNAGKRILESLTIAPVSQGFSEYELKMGSVQTIMASTGESLATVNQYLEELNHYADKTIYSFSDMTSNIGKFTNAGVKLEDAVKAIQGISNEAAISGANANEASRAMYNFAQALSAGYVKLIDWKSIENANMATVEFKQQLIETAVAMGTVKKVGDKYQSTTTDLNGKVSELFDSASMFNDSLSAQWMTSEVLVQALGNYAVDVREMSAAEKEAYEEKLKSIGYTEEQIKKIEELGQKAFDSAQDVKTFHQLMDTLAEAVGSGWAQTWEIIFGDFEEAKDLWTQVSKALGGAIDEMSEARNNFLSEGLSSGWKQFLDERITDAEGFKDTINTVAKESEDVYDVLYKSIADKSKDFSDEQLKAMGYTREQVDAFKELKKSIDESEITKSEFFDKAIEMNGGFEKSLREGWLSADVLSESITKLADKTRGLSDEELKAQGYTREQVEQIEALEKAVLDGTISLEDYARKMAALSGRENVIEGIKNVFTGLSNVVRPIGEAFQDVFEHAMPTADGLYSLTERFKNFSEGFKNFTSDSKAFGPIAYNIRNAFKGLFAIFDIGGQAISAVYKGVKSLVGEFIPLGEGILNVAGGFGDWISQLDNGIRNTRFFDNVVEKVVSGIKAGIQALKDFLAPLKENVGMPALETIKAMLENVEERMVSVDGIVSKVKTAAMNAIEQVSSAFSSSNLLSVLKTIWGFVTKIGGTLLSLAGGAIGKLFHQLSNADFSGVLDLLNALSVGGLAVVINKIFGGLKDGISFENLFKGFDGFKKSIIGTLDQVKDAFSAWQNDLKAGTLMKIAEAIAILSGSLLVLSLIDSGKLSEAIGGMTMMFTELVGSMAVLSKIDIQGKGVSTSANSMVKIAGAMLLAAFALKKLGDMDMGQIGRGLLGFAGLATIMTGCVAALEAAAKKFEAGKLKGLFSFAASMLLLTFALKNVADLKMDQIGQGLLAIGGLAAIMTLVIAALEAASNEYKEGKIKGLFSFAVSIDLLIVAFKFVSGMSIKEITKGLIGVGGLAMIMTVTIAALQAASAEYKEGSVKGLLSFAVAIDLLMITFNAIANMNINQIIKGLVGIGGIAAIMATTLGALTAITGEFDNGSILKAASSMLIMSAAILVLTPALMLLGNMSAESIAKALITLAGAFAIFGAAGTLLGPIAPAIITLSGAIALIGVGTLAAGVGLMAFAAGIAALGGALAAGSAGIIASLNIIISGIIMFIPNVIASIGEGIIKLCNVIAEGAPAIGEAVKSVILSLVDVLVECIPAIVDGAFRMITEVLASLVTYGPQIIDSLLLFVIQLIEGLAERMPDLIQAGVDLVMSFFTGIIDALSGIDTGVLVKGIAGVGLMAAIMVALSAVAALVPGAMVGVLGMGAVIAELALVLAAVGALAQIPGLNWLIGEGGKLLQGIGTAIGGFVGGIVGGFMSGVSSQFPQIGSDLSAFMTNVQPFIDGASSVDESLMSGVKALADAILVLTAADLLSGIASFFTGGSSLSDFGTQLVPFGESMKSFSDSIAGMDAELVVNAANAGKALSEMASTIPSTGGLFSFFSGEKDMTGFGEQLVAFGAAMLAYSVAIKGLDVEAVSNSVTAGTALVELASTIPNTGGLVSFLTGDNDMATFGTQLVSFGNAVRSYSEAVAGINVEAINSSVAAGNALSELANSLPNQGSLISFFTGDNDFTSFGEGLVSFGDSLSQFSQSVATVDVGKIMMCVTQVQMLIDLINNMSGINASTTSGFVAALSNLGRLGVTGFVSAFTNSYSQVVEAVNTFLNNAITQIKNKHMDFNNAGQGLVTKLVDGIKSKEAAISNTFSQIVSGAATALKNKYTEFYNAGMYLVEGFANGIIANTYKAQAQARAMASSAANAARAALDEHSPSKVGYQIGDFFGMPFVDAIKNYVDKAYSAGTNLGSAAKSGLTNSVSKIADFIDSNIDAEPTIRPVLDLSSVESGAVRLNSMLSRDQAIAIQNGFNRRAAAQATEAQTTSQPTQANWSFVQNNYSPKSLSRLELYRQTKNLFSSFKNQNTDTKGLVKA